jgi:hypothetical protein
MAGDSITINQRVVTFVTSDGHPITNLELFNLIKVPEYRYKSNPPSGGQIGSLPLNPLPGGSYSYRPTTIEGWISWPFQTDKDSDGKKLKDYYILKKFHLKNEGNDNFARFKLFKLGISFSYRLINNLSGHNELNFKTNINGFEQECSTALSFDPEGTNVNGTNYNYAPDYLNDSLPYAVMCVSDLTKKELDRKYLKGLVDYYLEVTRRIKFGNSKVFSRAYLSKIVDGINSGEINPGSDIERSPGLFTKFGDLVFGIDRWEKWKRIKDKVAGQEYERIVREQNPVATLTYDNRIVFEYSN